jgi:hypothetical protein
VALRASPVRATFSLDTTYRPTLDPMRRTSALLASATALLLAACTGGRPAPDDYLAVVTQVVTTMDRDARQHALGRPPRGPLWVDVRGFAGRGGEVTGVTVTKQQVMRALGSGVREADPQQVLLASGDEDVLAGTWVREYGVHVSPNAARGTRDQITMLVGNYSTDRRGLPTTICDRVWRMRFRRQADGQWRMAEQALTRDCAARQPGS